MGKKRPEKKTKKKATKAGAGSSKAAARGSREPVRSPETRDVVPDPETPQWLLPPRVEWLDPIHMQRTRAPKRVRRRMERIAKMVWRNIPERQCMVIDPASRKIHLMNRPAGKKSPKAQLDDMDFWVACWTPKLGILVDVAAETTCPVAEELYTYVVAHELAHVYLRSASVLISGGASMAPLKEFLSKSDLSRMKAVAAAYGGSPERDRKIEEPMANALVVAWGFEEDYMVARRLRREGRA